MASLASPLCILPASQSYSKASPQPRSVPAHSKQQSSSLSTRKPHRESLQVRSASSADPLTDPSSDSSPATLPPPLSPPLEEDPVLRARREKKEAWATPRASLAEKLIDILYVYGGLLDRPFGSGQIIAAAGSVVVERVRAEINAVLPQGPDGNNKTSGDKTKGENKTNSALSTGSPQKEQKKVQICFEILRSIQLLSMDLELMKAAVKEETLLPRLEAAKMKCKQAMSLARQL